VEVETDEGLKIKTAAARVQFQSAPAGKITLYIRPEVIALAPVGDAPRDSNRLTGRVAASAYQGSSVEYEVDVKGKSIRAHVANPKNLFNRGDEVVVVFDPKDVGCVVEEG
jgi:ABC-type Fe3+/spermidine/putrescine transport system ATPase subunit